MRIASQQDTKDDYQSLTDIAGLDQEHRLNLSAHIKMIWLLGIVILLPIRISQLPFHLELMDFWVLMGIPIIVFLFAIERQPIRLPYFAPMWVIFVASIISTYGATSQLNGVILVLKEFYLYIWFVIISTLFSTISGRNFKRILIVWSVVIILHGLLIIAQFLSADVWRFTTHLAGGSEVFNNYRSAGLFIDPDKAGSANKASFFQLLGYVPLAFAFTSNKSVAIIGAFLLFFSMLGTGSMGAITSLLVGLFTAITAYIILNKQYFAFVLRGFTLLAVIISFLGLAYFIISQNQDYQSHLESIVGGRAERSSEGRFELWQRGINVLLKQYVPIWGIGPENFRVVDIGHGKQLHNDTLAFLVERGLIGAFGLILFGITAVGRAINFMLIYGKRPGDIPFEAVVFFGAIAATLFESLTHQIFHTHQLWLVLALQEAMFFKAATNNSMNMILKRWPQGFKR